MEMTRTKLGEGVYLTYLPGGKFKTGLLSAQFVTPLERDNASAGALLPAVLRRGTVSCPDMGSLSARLDALYGARIDYTVRKKGENQCVGFVASLIDDSFAPGGERLLEPVAELLGELICAPITERGRFVPAYFDSEKQNLLDAIRSLINDKRDYADSRLLREMCAGEAYGVPRLGTEETAERLQPKRLYAWYQELISTARLELFYSGSAPQRRVEQALLAALSSLPRDQVREIALHQPHPARAEVLRVEEALDVTQGKLGMGFACGSDDYAAMMLGNTLFGGSSNSKLFLNEMCIRDSEIVAAPVRENGLAAAPGPEGLESGRKFHCGFQGAFQLWQGLGCAIEFFVDAGPDEDGEGVQNGAAQPVQPHGADLEDLLQGNFVIAAIPLQVNDNHGDRISPVLCRGGGGSPSSAQADLIVYKNSVT